MMMGCGIFALFSGLATMGLGGIFGLGGVFVLLTLTGAPMRGNLGIAPPPEIAVAEVPTQMAVATTTPTTPLRLVFAPAAPEGSYTDDDLQTALDVMRLRLDELGLADASVEMVDSWIVVDVSGDADPQQVVDTLTRMGRLEFVDFSGLQDRAATYVGQTILTTESSGADGAAPTESPDEIIPADSMLNPLTGKPFVTVLTGEGLESPRAEFMAQINQWAVAFEFTPEASAIIGEYTGSHIGEPMAIVLDGVVLTVPIIQSQISESGIVQGNFSENEVKTLALQLRTGALPFPLTQVQVLVN